MKYVLWDFDGTLGYRDGKWSAALVEAVRRVYPNSALTVADVRPYLQSGFPWHEPERIRSDNQPADEWWAALEPVFESALVGAAGFSSGEARRLARSVRDTYLDLRCWHLYDDVLDCLDTLQADGWKHAIVSNHVPELPMIVDHLGLGPYVSAVYSSANLGVEKPNPKIYQTVLADLKLDVDAGRETIPNAGGDAGAGASGHVWMIGDNPVADVLGAEAVGINAILVRGEDPRAKRCAADLTQVPRLLGIPDERIRRTNKGA